MKTPSILIVDDEPQIRRVIKAALSKQGYVVADARSGEVALDMIRDERFDMVILDRNMPGIGGLETCRAIRNTSDIGIIMLTVRKAENDRIEALDAGADDYVTKPFSMPELSARIRANLRRVPSASRSGAQTIRFGAVSADLATHHLSVAGVDVRLTPKQFEVLQYFVENANVSIPHAQLLQAVWGPDYRDEVEYLHVVVNQLRKKIEADPSHPRYIITEPWFGYRFQFPDDTDREAG
ncbi:MAG: response regulator transcription factor [Terracidiphilus sp.]|jgi:two-component system KDP operon response regulator KdpE